MSGIAPDKTPATQDLPAAGSVAGSNEVSVSQAGTLVRATLTQIVALAEGGSTPVADLPAVSSVSGSDLMRVSQSGTERKATLNDVIGLVPTSEPVSDTDVAGSGTSTTSNVAGGGVDTNIVLPLEIGTYLIVTQGQYINANGTGPRTQWVAANGLVHNFLITQSIQNTSATASQISMALDEGWTAHSSGSTASMAILIVSMINVTTAGDLKLRLASVNNGISVTLQEVVAAAFKL